MNLLVILQSYIQIVDISKIPHSLTNADLQRL